MRGNNKKFKILRYGNKEELKYPPITPDWDDFIKVNDNLRDLGIIMNDSSPYLTLVSGYLTCSKEKGIWH